MTHLILHKVRGEPAFDVAESLQIGDEEGWIIPTSGTGHILIVWTSRICKISRYQHARQAHYP